MVSEAFLSFRVEREETRPTFLGSLNEALRTVAGVNVPDPIEIPEEVAEGGEIEGE